MRLTLKIKGEPDQWIDMVDKWNRRMIRAWDDSLKVPTPGMTEEAQEALARETDERMLTLLRAWSSGCYLVDMDGAAYHSLDEITPEVLDNLDWPVVQFLYSAPYRARNERGRLGEVKGGS
jgi:hypothetical protein